ncbi:hypothetical protein ACFORL_11670 [Legionella dresdenensis]|uniref:Uncharacterized protein n=1 Tax=Legionella dresdenensis TaxID=450200 RepID=A0ABV8CI32_9GAMM
MYSLLLYIASIAYKAGWVVCSNISFFYQLLLGQTTQPTLNFLAMASLIRL